MHVSFPWVAPFTLIIDLSKNAIRIYRTICVSFPSLNLVHFLFLLDNGWEVAMLPIMTAH
jgi:hypothetical protein